MQDPDSTVRDYTNPGPPPNGEPKRQGNQVWCYSHACYESADDLIDYPVSDLYLDAAYRQGLTPRKSPFYSASVQQEAIFQEINGLREELATMTEDVTRLRRAAQSGVQPQRQSPPMPTGTVPKEPSILKKYGKPTE